MVKLTLPGVAGGKVNLKFLGEPGSEKLFGANFLFNRDGGQQEETISTTYTEFLNEASVKTLRYPGGTITEKYFDIRNPNSTSRVADVDGQAREPTVPLSTFLAFAASENASVTIVIPTYMFLQSEPDQTGHREVDQSKEVDLRNFIDFCLAEAARLGVKIDGFEIGNEWYVDNSSIFGFQMSPIEYGRVAAYISENIQEQIDQYSIFSRLQEEPAIVVQVGPGGAAEWYTPEGHPVPEDYTGPATTATELIFRQFDDPDAREAVDGILMHRYLHGSDENITGWAYNAFDTWEKLAAQTPGFKSDLDRYVTEWNVSARNDIELGIKQFDTMVELVEEMLRAGVDHANVWAIQQNNPTRLIANTGLGNEAYGGLTFAGLAFDMMSAQLPGLSVISSSPTIAGLTTSAFGSQDRVVYFLTNTSDSERSDTIAASDLRLLGHHVTIYEVTEGADGLPIVQVRTIDLGQAKGDINLTFTPNEAIMIVVARGGVGTEIEGYDLSDSLLGSTHNDLILGGNGNDTVNGSSGNDTLNGEVGNDSVIGGNGNDYILGGEGNDYILGGSGNDTLVGGNGLDTLAGGDGFDVVSFEDISTDLVFDMTNPSFNMGAPDLNSITGVEGAIGGKGNDRLRGNGTGNLLDGASGNDSIIGEAGNDTLTGGEGDDRLEGGLGNDWITGDAGRNILDGGLGNDTLIGGSEADYLFGGDGQDSILGGGGDDRVQAGVGGDSVDGGSGNDFLDGGDGDDSLVGGEGADTLLGNMGNDRLFAGNGFNLVDGGAGNDSIEGGNSADILRGGEGSDTLSGFDGSDSIGGAAGNDVLYGGGGTDLIEGGSGADRMFGGLGNDRLDGGAENDTINGDDGDDFAFGGDGADSVFGGAGADQIDGGSGNDLLNGGLGDDFLRDGVGNDLIFGEDGNDTLVSDSGNDSLFGGSGDDILISGLGVDQLSGGVGNDFLIAGSDISILTGGQGNDVFEFNADFKTSRVTDFQNDFDTLSFDAVLNPYGLGVEEFVGTYCRFDKGSAIFDFGDGQVLTVNGITSAAQIYDDLSFT